VIGKRWRVCRTCRVTRFDRKKERKKLALVAREREGDSLCDCVHICSAAVNDENEGSLAIINANRPEFLTQCRTLEKQHSHYMYKYKKELNKHTTSTFYRFVACVRAGRRLVKNKGNTAAAALLQKSNSKKKIFFCFTIRKKKCLSVPSVFFLASCLDRR